MQAKSNTSVLMSAGDLSKLIGTIGKQRVALDQKIQIAATQCIAQSIVHRNATPANQLFDAIHGSHRSDALVAHFEKFGYLAWSKGEKRIMFYDAGKVEGKDKAKAWTDEYAKVVAETLWHTSKKAPEPKSIYDADAEFGKFLSRLKRLGADPAVTVKNKALVAALEVVYTRYVADEAMKAAKVDETISAEAAKVEQARAQQENGATPASQEQLAELAQKFGGEQPKLVVNS